MRFEQVTVALPSGASALTISVGVAPARRGHSAEQLVHRADADLLARRGRRRAGRDRVLSGLRGCRAAP